jgi:hypothetical protein
LSEAISSFIHGSGLPVTILVFGGAAILFEAVRRSRHFFWADFFAEDMDD